MAKAIFKKVGPTLVALNENGRYSPVRDSRGNIVRGAGRDFLEIISLADQAVQTGAMDRETAVRNLIPATQGFATESRRVFERNLGRGNLEPRPSAARGTGVEDRTFGRARRDRDDDRNDDRDNNREDQRRREEEEASRAEQERLKQMEEIRKQEAERQRQLEEDLRERKRMAMETINNADLSEATKELLRATVDNWTPGMEVNLTNVLETFNKIKRSTIDPKFRELTNLAIREVESARDALEERQAERELVEGIQAEERIENIQEELSRRGMLFSGEAKKRLGSQSAFVEGQEGGLLGSGDIAEGEVERDNRLIAQGTNREFRERFGQLGRQTEERLGSELTEDLGIPQFNILGGVEGSLGEEQERFESQVFSGILGQARQNTADRQPITTDIEFKRIQ